MQIIEAKKGVFTGSTETLKSLAVSDSEALDVELKDVAVIRALISRLHRNSQMKFETKKTDTGILVWRIA